MREIVIKKNDAGQRLDKFLQKKFKTMPKSLMYKYLRTKYIKLNGKKASGDEFLLQDDVLTLYIKDEFFENAEKETKTENYEFLKAPKTFGIVFEDENVLIIDKKPGLIVHPDKNYHFDSLISRVLHYLYDKGEYRPENENSFTPALVNRIDRNTGGIVIAAKNAEALRILNSKMKARQIKKFYLCLVHGWLKKKSGILTGYITKDERKNKAAVSKKMTAGGKEIKTGYRVISEENNQSLLEIELFTGRTHQIRAQMTAIGHPLLGDKKYCKSEYMNDSKYKYQALYAYRVIFDFSGECGCLEYLSGRTFKLKKTPFAEIE